MNDLELQEQEDYETFYHHTFEEKYDEIIYKEALLSFTEREIIRNSNHFKTFIYEWNHGVYNNKNDVGAFMSEIKDYFSEYNKISGENPTRDLWAEYYFNNVRSYEQINILILKMLNATQLTEWKQAVNYWHIHIIDGAYVGMLGEAYGKQVLEEWFNDHMDYVEYASSDQDIKMGIDLLVYENGELTMGVQVKRTGYFYSKKATVVKAREGYNKNKYRLFTKTFNVPVKYLDVEALEKNNGLITEENFFNAKY